MIWSRRLRLLLASTVAVAASLSLAESPALGQDVRAYVRTDSVSVGERFTLTVIAERPVWARTVFAAPPADSSGEVLQVGDVLLLRKTLDTSLGESESNIDSVQYEAATFALDTALVGQIPVAIVSDPDTFTVSTAPFLLPVRSIVPNDAEDILDIAPIAEFPSPVWPWLLFLALLIVATAAFLYWYRRSPEIISLSRGDAVVERKSPLEEATERLTALERAGLNSEAAKKAFFVELSEILRTYIWRRLGPPALESTSREVLESLDMLIRDHEAPDTILAPTRRLLETSDLAKFAEIFPDEMRCRDSIAETREIVELVEGFLAPSAPVDDQETVTITDVE